MASVTGLEYVGRMRQMDPIYQSPSGKRYDEWFSQYLLHRNVRDTFEDFNVARPSARRELKAVARYGLATVEQPPSAEEQEILLDWLEREFGHHVENHRVVDLSEVEFQPTTTPGIPYKWFSKSKREAIKRWMPDIQSFWKYAHVLKVPVLWHNFCKEELLPQDKLDNDNVRSITGPDLAFFLASARLFQDFNKKLYGACLKTSSALGFNKFAGGLGAIAERINLHPHKEESDMSKYDARVARWLRLMCLRFRWRTLRMEDKTPETWARMCYHYDQELNSLLVTGMGHVLKTDHGTKSGSENTSSDGTLMHFVAVALSYIRLVSKDYNHFKRHVVALLYGDDELMSMSDEVVDLFCASKRAPIYESCGIHFKVGDTIEQLDLEGLSFLGSKFMRTSSGHWVGLPTKPRKTVASALKPLRKQTPGESLTRALALLVEGFWDTKTREILHGFVRWMVSQGFKPTGGRVEDEFDSGLHDLVMSIPTLRRIRDHWIGLQ